MSDSCNSMDCSLAGSTVHGTSQARILEWVAIAFSRESSWLWNEPASSAQAGGFFATEPPGKLYIHIHTCICMYMKIKILRKNILSILKLFHSYLLRHVSAVTICSPSKGQSPYLGSRSYSLLFVEGHHPSSFSLSYLHQQFSPLMDLSLQIFCLKSPLGMQCTPANTSFLSFPPLPSLSQRFRLYFFSRSTFNIVAI